MVREVIAVAVVALAMFVLWRDPGSALGTVVVFIVGALVIVRAWTMPARELRTVPPDSATDPNAAAQQLETVAGRMMNILMIPTAVGLLATLISRGWQPVVFGALITIAGFTFFGPFRTKLAGWRDTIEAKGGKTGL